jgi:hypothetical protein
MATRLYTHYGERKLVEPAPEPAYAIWKLIGEHLLHSFRPGSYQDPKLINSVLNTAFDFVEKRLARLLRRLASHEFMQFILYQYDLATELWRRTPDSGNDHEAQRESHLISRRRALKHLAEQVALRSPPEYSPIHFHSLINEAEEAILCADISVILSVMSDRTHFLFPRQSRLILSGGGNHPPFQVEIMDPFEFAVMDFMKRVTKDRANRQKYLPNPTADLDVLFQSTVLDPYFTEEFGLPYGQFLYMLARVLEDVAPAQGGYPIVFCHKERLIQEIASVTAIPNSTAKRIIDGFTLQASDMKREGRKLWNAKQTFRAYRRGFFEFPHASGPHLIWSNKMMGECLDWLLTGASFKKLPIEWQTPRILGALDKVSQKASAWFERQTTACLSDLGIIGSRRKGRIQNGNVSIEIPPSVGEIDFLGRFRDEPALVIVECKMVENRMEARFWKEDIVDFVHGGKCYSEKFKTKISWLVENATMIGKALTGFANITEIKTVMLTLYPSFAATHVTDFPCVSLAEFMADCETENSWPYIKGIFATA